MPRHTRWMPTLAAAIGLSAISGCYEYEEDPAAAASPAAPGHGAPGPAAGSGQSAAEPSHAGARQTARNTVDRIGERQQELEKALEDQD